MKLRIAGLVVSILLMSLSFQNCGKAGFQASDTSLGSGLSFSADQGLISAKFAGSFDSNCLNNPNYDACLFWKNPVAERGLKYASILTFGSNVEADQTFGVKLTGLTDGTTLTSKSLYVYFSGSNVDQELRLPLSNGRFKQSYKSDGNATSSTASSKSVAQLMAYFWLNHLQTQLKTRTGTSYSENSLTYVDAFAADPALSSSVEDNAFFTYGTKPTDRYILMGYATTTQNGQTVKAHEIALSAEPYLHEMGHGNLHAAKGNDPSTISADSNHVRNYRITACSSDSSYVSDPVKNFGEYTDAAITNLNKICNPSGNGKFDYFLITSCKTNQGCLDGINEGQADFHYLMIFPDAPALGETIFNKLDGGFEVGPKLARKLVSGNLYQCLNSIVAPAVKRNPAAILGMTVEDIFQGSTSQLNNCTTEVPGEIHGMGSAYASILWEIYTNPKIDPRLFEKAFQAHLQKLSNSTDFPAAWSALRADYLAVGGEVEGQKVIDDVFTRKGVNKPGSL